MPIPELHPSFTFTEGLGSSERVLQQHFADLDSDVDLENWRTAKPIAMHPMEDLMQGFAD